LGVKGSTPRHAKEPFISTTEPFPPSPAPVQPAPKPRRLRRVVFATALLLTGGVIGAVVAGPTLAQRWDGPPWAHGGGFSPRHDMGGPGGRMFFPGPIERGVERLGWATDASTEQKTKINAIAQKAADDIFALRAKHLEARKQVIETLAAPTVDRAKLEALRADQMKLAETATKRVTDAVADIADVLTPAQRADLGQRVERWDRWFRG
jgi:Spy/CpxP family protein refolding chaperone